MNDIKIEVTPYEGYRGAERPRSFLFEGQSVDVLGIVRMWVEEEHRSRKQRKFFVVQGDDGYLSTLFQDLETGEWFMRSREKAS